MACVADPRGSAHRLRRRRYCGAPPPRGRGACRCRLLRGILDARCLFPDTSPRTGGHRSPHLHDGSWVHLDPRQSHHHATGRRDRNQPPHRQPERVHARSRVLPFSPHRNLLHRIHARGGGQAAILRGDRAVRRGDAGDRERGQFPPAPDLLGDHGAVLVPSHRVLVSQAGGGERGEEGVPRHACGRCPLPSGGSHHLERLSHVPVRGDRRKAPCVVAVHGARTHSAHPPAPLRRGGGKVRAVPAPRMAPGRDGGPDHGVRPDPRCDDGEGGRLPDRAFVHLPRPHRASDGRGHRCRGSVEGDPDHRRRRGLYRNLCGLHGPRELRHQAGPRVLHDQPTRIHVPRIGRGRVPDGLRGDTAWRGTHHRRVQRGPLPPDEPRVLQGPPLPLGGLRDSRRPHERHAGDGRAKEAHAVDLAHDADGGARPRGDHSVQRLLLEGRHSRRDVRDGRREPSLLSHVARRNRDRLHDRVLHVPHVADDVPRDVPWRGPPA